MNNKLKKEFTEAYQNYAPVILKHIYFRVENWEISEDLMQETFCKTWQYMSTNDRKIKLIKNFLYVVSNNLIADYYKGKIKKPVYIDELKEEIPFLPTQINEVDEKLRMDELQKYILNLKEKHRVIINYRYVDYLSIKEIAVLTNKSPNYVSVILHRCRKTIKKYQKNSNQRFLS